MKLNTILVPILLVTTLLTVSCGKKAPQPPFQNVSQSKKNEPVDTCKNVKTFAESLEAIDFSYNEETKLAKLGFTYCNMDKKDNDGVHFFTEISGLEGKIESNRAKLSLDKLPEYEAQLVCRDEKCLNFEMTLEKKQGRVRGQATVKQKAYVDTNLFITADKKKFSSNPKTLQTIALSLTETEESRSTTLKLIDIEGGRKNFFDLRVVFLKQIPINEDLKYFSRKDVRINGDRGQNATIRLGVFLSEYGNNFASVDGKSTPYAANVSYDKTREAVDITFIRNEISDDPEVSLFVSAGKTIKKLILED